MKMAEVTALVVRMAAKNESVLMPPDLVDKSVGTAIMLNVTKEQFAMGASRSPRFDARMFTRADTKTLTKVIPLVSREQAAIGGKHYRQHRPDERGSRIAQLAAAGA